MLCAVLVAPVRESRFLKESEVLVYAVIRDFNEYNNFQGENKRGNIG